MNGFARVVWALADGGEAVPAVLDRRCLGTGSTPASWPRKAAGVRVNHAGSQYSTNTRFNTFAPDAAYDLRVGNSRRTIIRTAGLTLSLASGVMLALWCLVELTPWGWFVPMAISAVGNGLSQLPAARVAGCRTIALWRWSQWSLPPWRLAWLSASSPCVGPARRHARLDLRGLEPDPKAYCVRRGVVIAGYGADRDGEQRFGRRSTVGSIGGRATVIRAI